METGAKDEALRRIIGMVCDLGKLDRLGPDEDFYVAGLSSVRALELLMELEAAFEVSLSDEEFIAARTPRALLALVEKEGVPA